MAGSAFVKAAQTIAPGLLQAGRRAQSPRRNAALPGQSGCWFRRGNKIILQGA